MPRAAQFDFPPRPNPQHTNRWGDPLRGILRNSHVPGAPGALMGARPRRSRPAAMFPGANYPDYQHHCQCCHCNSDRPPFPTSTNPRFPLPLPQDPQQHPIQPSHQQQPVEPQTTWLYPSGTLQWTPNTFTGANSSIPLPPDEMPTQWLGAAVPDTMSRIKLEPMLSDGLTKWNISRRPSTATQQPSGAALATLFSRPALQPEFRKITIDVGAETGVPHWAFAWGRLRVKAEDPAGITVKNVMDAIYNYFHTPLNAADLGMVREADREALLRTQSMRINSRGGHHRLVDPGLLRVDLLLGRHYFQNMSVVSFQGGHCKVVLCLNYNPGF